MTHTPGPWQVAGTTSIDNRKAVAVSRTGFSTRIAVAAAAPEDRMVCGLFAGVGGLELGFHQAGFSSSLLCEIDPPAQAVLREKFPGVPLHDDIRTLSELPPSAVVTAGFPCQDLSMAGSKVGINGSRSGLVGKLLELLDQANWRAPQSRPRWLVIENVPYMLHLDRGQAIARIVKELERFGYSWAYRVVDARAFGVPQRRLRVLFVASPIEDPRRVLFGDEVEPRVDDSTSISDPTLAYGFYWTEGKRGLGWTVDGVPTVKGGSTIGIPSPPAVWARPSGEIGTPDIRDLERLQGLPEGWTEAAADKSKGGSRNARWRLLGNAVCMPVAQWLGSRIAKPADVFATGSPVRSGARWPNAAWGSPGISPHKVEISTWPLERKRIPLLEFLHYPLKPLSLRATVGYLTRAHAASSLRFPEGFLDAVRSHADRLQVVEKERLGV